MNAGRAEHIIVEFQNRHARLARLRDLERFVIPGTQAELDLLRREAAEIRRALGMAR